MQAVEIDHVTKVYGDKPVVSDLSFAVGEGDLFGLIGPNGAGKTTTIRMLMDITRPDSGTITLFGRRLDESMKGSLGYLPEERGLYRKQKVVDSIKYLASLKGVDPKTAVARAEPFLNRTGLLSSLNKKTEELSKGMGQIIQFIVTILHDPRLIILDEPFSGLDPVNTELLKSILRDLRDQGKAIVFSTHQMNQVEELCDRVLMINHGAAVLYGPIKEIKSRYRDNSIVVDYDGGPLDLPGVTSRHVHENYQEWSLAANTTPQQVLSRLIESGRTVNRFEIATPSLNDIFIKLAGKNHE